MKVHLVRSNELNRELFTKVVDLLRAVPGPIIFLCDPDSMVDFNQDEVFEGEYATRKTLPTYNLTLPTGYKIPTATWDTLFDKCARYRTKHDIPAHEYVFLLTDVRNDLNWFASLDRRSRFNGFINTADWNYLVQSPAAFPIAYEVVALILHGQMFPDFETAMQSVHQEPIGCVSDLCMQKQEIILKLRTADICHSCMDRLRGTMSMPMVKQVLQIMESLRVKMLYAQNFRQYSGPGRMMVNQMMEIQFPDFGDIKIKLRPLEKALYRLFLNHPNGIRRIEMPDYREELQRIYAGLSRADEPRVSRQRIDDLCSILNNSAEEKISRIKRVFTEALGKDLAGHYYISGERGEPYLIPLDRSFVIG